MDNSGTAKKERAVRKSAGSALLLFDEAYALFGKRSKVKDAHSRPCPLSGVKRT